MHVPVEIQVWRVAVLALLGIGTDLLFHTYRAYRSVFRPKNLGYHLLDALIALVTLAAVGVVVLIVNWGEVRFYVPASLAGGFLVGNLLVGDLVYRSSRAAFLRLQKSLRWAKLKVVDPPKRAVRHAFSWVNQKLATFATPEPPTDVPPDVPPNVPPDAPPPE